MATVSGTSNEQSNIRLNDRKAVKKLLAKWVKSQMFIYISGRKAGMLIVPCWNLNTEPKTIEVFSKLLQPHQKMNAKRLHPKVDCES